MKFIQTVSINKLATRLVFVFSASLSVVINSSAQTIKLKARAAQKSPSSRLKIQKVALALFKLSICSRKQPFLPER